MGIHVDDRLIASRRINHVGMLVEDWAAAVSFLSKLGFVKTDEFENETLRAAFLSCGGVDVEVIHLLDPEERGRRKGDGPARLEHIAVEVDHLDEFATLITDLGGELQGPPYRTPRFRTFFTKPETTGGVVYQFVEISGRPSGAIRVLRIQEIKPIDRGPGIETLPLVGPGTGAVSFSSGITQLAAGAALDFHFHNCEESVTVLAGEAIFESEAGELRMATLDTTLVPVGAIHRFRNDSEVPLRILFVYGSSHPSRTIVESGPKTVVG